MKKTVSLILALILVCSISVSALAAPAKAKKSPTDVIGKITIGELFGSVSGLFPKDPFDGFLEDFTKGLGITGSLGENLGNLLKGMLPK